MNPKNITFQKSIEIVKKKLHSKSRSPIAYLYLDLTRYKNYIKKIQSQNAELSIKELQEKILDFHLKIIWIYVLVSTYRIILLNLTIYMNL